MINSPLIHSDITISIVSHLHGSLVESLLYDIDQSDLCTSNIIITFNKPEDESFINKFPNLNILVLRNTLEIGFGENHNKAFLYCTTEYFIILNPDINIPKDFNISLLLSNFEEINAGVCAPLVLSSIGKIEDSARKFPTLHNLILRRLFRSRTLDYKIGAIPISVDWVAGMFMIFQSNTFLKLNGFDEGFFLYFEDVDICKRLRAFNLNAILDPRTYVIHHARRDSNKKFKFLAMHIKSMVRYFI